MTCRRLSLVLLTLLVTTPRASAAPAADAARVERLVAQLGSTSWLRRQRATRTLRALGPRATAALRRAVTSADLEIRRRARGLLAPRASTLASRPAIDDPHSIVLQLGARGNQGRAAQALQAALRAHLQANPGRRLANPQPPQRAVEALHAQLRAHLEARRGLRLAVPRQPQRAAQAARRLLEAQRALRNRPPQPRPQPKPARQPSQRKP